MTDTPLLSHSLCSLCFYGLMIAPADLDTHSGHSLCPSHCIVSPLSSLRILTQLYIWSMTELTITIRKGGKVNTLTFARESQRQTGLHKTIHTKNRELLNTWTLFVLYFQAPVQVLFYIINSTNLQTSVVTKCGQDDTKYDI